MIIFCDGVFDIFHMGHVNHFKKIKETFKNCYLIVGVLNDKISTSYKRFPFFNENYRLELVKSCKYVDEVTLDYPYIMTNEFIINKKIDYIVHAFSNKTDLDKQSNMFEIPIKLNKMKILDYNNGISTTDLLNNINNLINKEKEPINNFYNNFYSNLIKKLNITSKDKILEFNCKNSNLINLFNKNNLDYYGISNSKESVIKILSKNKSKVIISELNNTPFKDNFFNYTFMIYDDLDVNINYLIKEMERITINKIYIIYNKNIYKIDTTEIHSNFTNNYKELIISL